jgi:hypothetical protein
MTSADFQWYLEEPVTVNTAGEIVAPNAPGLGVQPGPEKLNFCRA